MNLQKFTVKLTKEPWQDAQVFDAPDAVSAVTQAAGLYYDDFDCWIWMAGRPAVFDVRPCRRGRPPKSSQFKVWSTPSEDGPTFYAEPTP